MHTLEVALEGILGGLHSLLGLEPDQTELFLDIVGHDGLVLTTALAAFLGGGVGALQLEVLVLLLEVLLAVALVEEAVLLDLVGVGEELVSGNDVLSGKKRLVVDVDSGVGRETNGVDDHVGG